MNNIAEAKELMSYLDSKINVLSPKVEQLIQYTIKVNITLDICIILCGILLILMVYLYSKIERDPDNFINYSETVLYCVGIFLVSTGVIELIIIWIDPEMWAIKKILNI